MADDDQPAFPDDAEQRFAANLRILREREGISQVKLAREMAARGWPWRQQTVTRLENGQRMVRYGEAIALAEILGAPLDRFTRAAQEASEAEKVYKIGARLRQSYEDVAGAVCRLMGDQRAAARIRAVHAASTYEYVQKALADLAAQMEECTVDEAIAEGTRRFTELNEKGEKRGWEGGAAEPAAPNAGEPTAASGDEGETVSAPGRAGNT